MGFVLIVGAKSDIAKAVAVEYAKNGYDLYLAAKNSHELIDFSNDIQIRFKRKAICIELNILDYNGQQSMYASLDPKPVGVISAVGYLGDQKKAQSDIDEVKNIININYTGLVHMFHIIANDFEGRKSGFIVGISSVAGDRGRKSNYLYGSAKSAFSTYLSGLRNRLFEANVQVLTVKPGFVATKMTSGMILPEKLTAQPTDVARDIFSAQQKGKDILYTKWIWQWIMLAIKAIPEWLFKKMSI